MYENKNEGSANLYHNHVNKTMTFAPKPVIGTDLGPVLDSTIYIEHAGALIWSYHMHMCIYIYSNHIDHIVDSIISTTEKEDVGNVGGVPHQLFPKHSAATPYYYKS